LGSSDSKNNNVQEKYEDIPPKPLPPALPKQVSAPHIYPETSRIEQEWKTLVNNPSDADVEFQLSSDTIYAHKIMLCSSSTLFHRLLFSSSTSSSSAQIKKQIETEEKQDVKQEKNKVIKENDMQAKNMESIEPGNGEEPGLEKKRR